MKLSKIFLSVFIIFATNLFAKGMPEEFYQIKNIKETKSYFFKYLYKMIKNENNKILEERTFVKTMLNSNLLNINANSEEFLRLLKLKKKYRIKKLFDLTSYMKKIDIIPPSMSLAQAAVESGWGKSRFIKEANNIFGHWTYNSEIGMIPEQRKDEDKHFIRIFKTLQASISAYMLNLNRNKAYKSFHKERYKMRIANKELSGLALSQTMLNYSGIGEEYLSILKIVIKKNKLETYDKKFYQEIKK
ncbi:MAG: mannosyl-glycoprotein endo-beta-N-acetylglucosamidase [Arcobacter sp.]|nr:mannosyl-glycoprotein endo-beta-N-acetylglucosamidase [Arcobacter sp.]|tara:strand:+ start:37 stop:774 length:738 start_codon:yes stop_codon:yes gene_type:complete